MTNILKPVILPGHKLLSKTVDFKLDNTTILWINDTFDYNQLNLFLQNKGKPKYMVNDIAFCNHDLDIYSIPWWFSAWAEVLKNLPCTDSIESEYCFNFMVNKKLSNRQIMLKMIEYFDLHSDHYTWSGISKDFDMTDFINELNSLNTPLEMNKTDYEIFFAKILSPCNIVPKVINCPGQQITNVSIQFSVGNVFWVWYNGLDKIFQKTAVSLISESVGFQKASVMTEKTIYSVLGLTFPIWIGGYGMADAWAKAGLDNFSDVVDHSYQYRDTLIERCYYAFRDNLPLLKDLSFAHNSRVKCHERLLKNREKLLNGALRKYCDNTIKNWPEDLQQATLQIVEELNQTIGRAYKSTE